MRSQKVGLDQWKSDWFCNFDVMIHKESLGIDTAHHLNKDNIQSRRILETPLNQTFQNSNLQFQNRTESCEEV